MPRARSRSNASGVSRTDLPMMREVVPGVRLSIWRSETTPVSILAADEAGAAADAALLAGARGRAQTEHPPAFFDLLTRAPVLENLEKAGDERVQVGVALDRH